MDHWEGEPEGEEEEEETNWEVLSKKLKFTRDVVLVKGA